MPIGRLDLKKELLIAAWFWIGAIVTGVLLAMALSCVFTTTEPIISLCIRRDVPMGVKIEYVMEDHRRFEIAEQRKTLAPLLVVTTFLTCIAWMFHSRRFSLRVFMTAALLVGFFGAVPYIDLGRQKPPGAYAEYILLPGQLTDPQFKEVIDALQEKVALAEMPEELRTRFSNHRIQRRIDAFAPANVTLSFWPDTGISEGDMVSLAAFYAQYMDILVCERLPNVIVNPAIMAQVDCEWSRRWAPTFEAKYRARKAAAKVLAEKEKKPQGP